MPRISDTAIVLVALLHIGFMIVETFLWRSQRVATAFGMTKAVTEATAPLAANQGVYNLFLAAGLMFALANRGSDQFIATATFFLACVSIAGIFGAATVSSRIFFIQGLPALAALAALWAGL